MNQPGPTPHPWPQPTPSDSGRRWFPVFVVAAIVVAGALIAGAIVLTGGDKSQRPAVASTTSAQPAAVPDGSTGTCKAFRAASAVMDGIPPLPDGADFNTPNIDALIANQNAALDKALDSFEAKIEPNDPPHVVKAAKAYIATKRTDMSVLNQLCTS